MEKTNKVETANPSSVSELHVFVDVWFRGNVSKGKWFDNMNLFMYCARANDFFFCKRKKQTSSSGKASGLAWQSDEDVTAFGASS